MTIPFLDPASLNPLLFCAPSPGTKELWLVKNLGGKGEGKEPARHLYGVRGIRCFKSLSYLPLRKGEDEFPSFVKPVLNLLKEGIKGDLSLHPHPTSPIKGEVILYKGGDLCKQALVLPAADSGAGVLTDGANAIGCCFRIQAAALADGIFPADVFGQANEQGVVFVE